MPNFTGFIQRCLTFLVGDARVSPRGHQNAHCFQQAFVDCWTDRKMKRRRAKC